jgi:hypothetical protein
MSNRLRRILAVMAATLMLATSVSAGTVSPVDSANAPAAIDVLLLRPAGLLSLVVGTGLFLASAPIILLTRPQEIGTPFEQLVVRPAKYIWVDPIGGH